MRFSIRVLPLRPEEAVLAKQSVPVDRPLWQFYFAVAELQTPPDSRGIVAEVLFVDQVGGGGHFPFYLFYFENENTDFSFLKFFSDVKNKIYSKNDKSLKKKKI